MADVFVPSVNDAAVFTTDKFGLLKDGYGNTYRTVVKANVNGNYDVYSKGTGTFGADELLYQYNASSNQVDFRDGKFKDLPTAAYNSFFKSGNANVFDRDVKKTWYGESPPNSAKRMATFDGYKSIAATVPIRQAQTNVPGGSLTIQTASGPVTTSVPTATDPAVAVAAEDKKTFEEALKDLKGNSRKKYDPNLRYPEKLQLEYQDCIKFSALEYKPPGLNASSGGSNENRSVTLDSFKRPTIGKDGKREILGSVTLPIPGGISDGNSVDWQDDKLDPFGKAFASIAVEGITNGGEGAFKELSSQFKGARTSGLLAMVPSKFAEAATGTSNLLQRTTGAAPNPNLELLFTGPSLRSFTFNFRLSPRSKEEAIIVRKIIRFFKQTMSVKRSTSTLLLGSPHTFAIAYLTSNKEHPYLNKFKECALQSCNVSYTPDGNYMSFNGPEPSMTSYEMSLTFKELEPIFDDDYKQLDNNNDTFIGY
jgi:hypothetical protein